MRIAVLHPERSEADLIVQVLQSAGHTCRISHDVSSVLALLDTGEIDLLILDCQATDQSDGAVTRVRDRCTAPVPLLFLGTRHGEDAILVALLAGVDDYLIKPVRRGELATRVRLLLRRAYPRQDRAPDICFDNYTFEVQARRLTHEGVPIELTQKEFDLALLFFQNKGRPLSRAYISEAVWPTLRDLPSRTIDTHVSRVRTKLGLRPENGYRLIPVYSYGYRLEQLEAERVGKK